MGSLAIERPCTMEPGLALARAADALAKIGYEIVSRSTHEFHLFYSAGSHTALRLDEHRHRLGIRADGQKLVFLFEAGLSSGGVVVQSERDELERRVAIATRSAGAPAPGAPRRCLTCGTLSDAGATTCATCGSSL